MRHWKLAMDGINLLPVMQGEPCAYVTRERWEIASESSVPMPFSWAEPFDGQLVDLGELLPVMYDPAALDAFTSEGGPGLWPVEPMTEEEVQISIENGDEFIEFEQVLFATPQPRGGAPLPTHGD